jgi:hypothetical protein
MQCRLSNRPVNGVSRVRVLLLSLRKGLPRIRHAEEVSQDPFACFPQRLYGATPCSGSDRAPPARQWLVIAVTRDGPQTSTKAGAGYYAVCSELSSQPQGSSLWVSQRQTALNGLSMTYRNTPPDHASPAFRCGRITTFFLSS